MWKSVAQLAHGGPRSLCFVACSGKLLIKTSHKHCRAAVADAVDDAVHGEKPVAVLAGWQQSESLRGRLPGSTVVEGPLTRQLVQEIAQA